jgi:hypothetical protein
MSTPLNVASYFDANSTLAHAAPGTAFGIAPTNDTSFDVSQNIVWGTDATNNASLLSVLKSNAIVSDLKTLVLGQNTGYVVTECTLDISQPSDFNFVNYVKQHNSSIVGFVNTVNLYITYVIKVLDKDTGDMSTQTQRRKFIITALTELA